MNIIEKIKKYVEEQGNQVGTEGLSDILTYFANKEGMSQLILMYNDNVEEGITDLNGNRYMFEDILEAIKDTTKFVYLIYDGAWLCLPALNFFDDMVQFSGTYILGSEPNFVRVSIDSGEQIKAYTLSIERNECEVLHIDAFTSVSLTKEQAQAIGYNVEVKNLIENDNRPVIAFNGNKHIAFNHSRTTTSGHIYTSVVFDDDSNKTYKIALKLNNDLSINYNVSQL